MGNTTRKGAFIVSGFPWDMEENPARPRPQVRRKTSLKCTLKTKVVPHGMASRKKSDSRPPKLLLGLQEDLRALRLRRVQQAIEGESSPSPEVVPDDEHLHTPSTWKLKFSPRSPLLPMPTSRSAPNLVLLSKPTTPDTSTSSSQINMESDSKSKGGKPALAKKPVIMAKTPPALSPIEARGKLSLAPKTIEDMTNTQSGVRTPPVVPTKPKLRDKPKAGNSSPGTISDKTVIKTDNSPDIIASPPAGDISPLDKPECKPSGSNISKIKARFENQTLGASEMRPRGKSPSPRIQAQREKSPSPFFAGVPPVSSKPQSNDSAPKQTNDSVQSNTNDLDQKSSRPNSMHNNDYFTPSPRMKSQGTRGNRGSDSSAYDDVLIISDGSDSESGKVRVTITSNLRGHTQELLLGDTDSGHGSTISTDEVGILPNIDGNGDGNWSDWVDESPPSPTKLHPQLRQRGRSPGSRQRHSADLSSRPTRRVSAPKSRFWSNPEKTISVLSTSPSADYDDVVLPGETAEHEWETDSEASDPEKSSSPPATPTEPEVCVVPADNKEPASMQTVEEDPSSTTPQSQPPPKPPRASIDIPILPPRSYQKTSPYGSPKLSPRESPYSRKDSPRVSPRNSPCGSPRVPRRKISLDSSIPAPCLPGVSRSRDGSGHSDHSGSSTGGDARPDSPPALPRRRLGTGTGDISAAPALPARQKTTPRGAPPIPPPRATEAPIPFPSSSSKHDGMPPPTPPRNAILTRPTDLKPDTIVPLSPEAREAAKKEKEEQHKPKLHTRRKTVDQIVPPSLSCSSLPRPQRSQSTTNLRTTVESCPTISSSDNSMLGEVPPPPPFRSRNRGDEYVGPDPPPHDAPPIPNNGYLAMNAVRPQLPLPRSTKDLKDNYIDSSEIESLPPLTSVTASAVSTTSSTGTPVPFSDLWAHIHNEPPPTDGDDYLTILPGEEGEDGRTFEIERSSSKRFVDEPLYQIYHCGAVARDVLVQHHEDEDGQDDADLYPVYDPENDEGSESPSEIYSTWEQLANSTPSPDVMASKLQNLIKTSTGVRTLWCEMPEVKESGILSEMSQEDKKLQEALFEVITSEASYLKSLNLLISHFKAARELRVPMITKSDHHVLFSNIEAVRNVSEKFMTELEGIWQKDFVLKPSLLCDTITKYASEPFQVYVKYCSNLTYQERRLKELKASNPGFSESLQQLERNGACHSLPMQSFLSSPMQRITRFPLLVDSVCHRIKYTDPYYNNVTDALHGLQKLVRQCNEGARQMENLEKISKIDSSLEFKNVKKMALVSAGRFLVKSGPLTHVLKEAGGLLIKKRKETLNLYLFNDILIITKKKSEGVYQVVDYASRIHCHADFVKEEEVSKQLPHGLPTSCRHVFIMALLENHKKEPRDFFFSCESESERMRWVEAVTPAQQITDDERIYEEWACPQVQAIHRYGATEPDELTLEESDVVNVRRKMKDGWYEGERLRDGERGWFPANHTVEIQSERVRSRNLLQRYRLLTLHTQPAATGIS